MGHPSICTLYCVYARVECGMLDDHDVDDGDDADDSIVSVHLPLCYEK